MAAPQYRAKDAAGPLPAARRIPGRTRFPGEPTTTTAQEATA